MEVLFKKIAVEQLSNLLSEYVEGLDHEKLNAASDSVTLTSLRLKENDLPGVGLRVKGGYIKTLKLQVPWKRLKRESVVVTVDEVFVVLGARAVTGATPPSLQSLLQLLCARRQLLAHCRSLPPVAPHSRGSSICMEPVPGSQARQARHR